MLTIDKRQRSWCNWVECGMSECYRSSDYWVWLISFRTFWKVLQVIRCCKKPLVSNFHLILIFSTLKRLLKWYVVRTYFLQTLPLHIFQIHSDQSAICSIRGMQNTMGNALVDADSEQPCRPKGGFGGYLTECEYTVANEELRELLRKDIDVIGGGVRTLVFERINRTWQNSLHPQTLEPRYGTWRVRNDSLWGICCASRNVPLDRRAEMFWTHCNWASKHDANERVRYNWRVSRKIETMGQGTCDS